MTVGRGCATTALPQTTPTVPPTPFPTPHAAAHAAAHAAPDAPAAAAHSAACPRRTCCSLQLRSRAVFRLGPSQAAVVLQDPPHLWPTDATAGPSRPLQLRGWFCQLASGLVCAEKGVVLPGAWQRLPESGRWMHDIV